MAYEKAMNKMNEDFVFTWDYEKDNEMLINTIKEDAEQEGMEKGMKKQQIEMAKNLINKKMSLDFIQEVTNLSKI